MADFQRQKNKGHNIWHSPIILFLMLVIVLVFIYNMIDIMGKVQETSKRKNLINAQVEDLKNKEEILNQKIEKLNTEEGVEEELREKYQLVKKGEKLVIIVDKNREEKESDEMSPKSKNKISRFFSNLFK